MTTGITLEIPAKAEYLSLVRAVVVSAAALDPAVEDQRLEDLRLAVSEATTNAIRSHANLGSEERITIRCGLTADRIEAWASVLYLYFDPVICKAAPDSYSFF